VIARGAGRASLLVAAMTLVGCTQMEATPMDTPTSSGTAGAHTAIRIETSAGDFDGTLDDSATARDLISRLPLTATFEDLAGQEKLTRLQSPLSMDGAPSSSGAKPNDIGYYGPGRSVVLYYATVSPYSGIVPIGQFDGDASQLREGDTIEVTISLADGD
jgi:hypothetical protein